MENRRRSTTRRWLAFIDAVVLILALGRYGISQSEIRSAENPVSSPLSTIPAPTGARASLRLLVVGANGRTQPLQGVARPDAPLVAVVSFEQIPPDAPLSLRWTAAQGNHPVGSVLLAPSERGEFSIRSDPPAGGWQLGRHVIEVLIGTTLLAKIEFSVKA